MISLNNKIKTAINKIDNSFISVFKRNGSYAFIIKSILLSCLLNIILFLLNYAYLSLGEDGLYLKFVSIAIITLVIWSSFVGVIFTHNLLFRHLPIIALPYVWCCVEFINDGVCPKVYYCSQVFHLFSFGILFLAIDFLITGERALQLWRKICLWVWNIFISFIYMLFVIISLNKIIYGIGINRDAIIAVCQTDYSEVCGYISTLPHGGLVVLLTGTLFVGLFLLFVYRIRLLQNKYHKCSHLTLLVFFFLLLVPLYHFEVEIIGKGRIYKLKTAILLLTPFQYHQELVAYNSLRLTRQREIERILSSVSTTDTPPGRYVLIVGESANPHYMNCYGHQELTTPFQTSMKDEPSFFLFRRAYACYAQTVKVFSMMMTDWNQYDGISDSSGPKSFLNSVSLIEIANHYGFNTSWYSNQAASGANDSPIIALANGANTTFFLSSQRTTLKKKCYDLELIPFLPELNNEKELVIIHLKGSHLPYRNCVPIDYDRASSLSVYELSMKYTDEVLYGIFKYCVKNHVDVIVYLSDHSDAVASGKGHDPRPEVFTQEMVEIPMWVYVSQDFQRRNPDVNKKLQYAADEKVFTNDLTFNLMLSLMGIHNTFTSSSYDVLDSAYAINSENAKTGYGTYKLVIPPNGNCKAEYTPKVKK